MSLDPPGIQMHPIFLVTFVRRGAGGKQLQSKGHFPTAEKPGMSSQGAAQPLHQGGWVRVCGKVCL